MIIPNRYIQKIGSNFDWCEKKIYGADEGDDLKWKQNKQIPIILLILDLVQLVFNIRSLLH